MQKIDNQEVSQAIFEGDIKIDSDLSVLELVDYLIQEAYRRRASDVHIDPTEDRVRVRMRIDGVLYDIHTIPKLIQSEIITRIKVMAGLRTDDHQSAHDGRFRIAAPDDNKGFIDIRVSIAPTYYGENIVLRLLSDKEEQFSLDSLGFSTENKEKVEKAMSKPYGMILATGPTGSGKTTTLYTVLKRLNSPEVSIITIEDPIEYAIGGLVQIQVNPRTGLTFANGLRSMLRQDPNIIMVGEIRDPETAGIAVNTSLTGHLLLSTLHTNDAATTLPRLLDLKIEPYLIASTVNLVIGQRLVRKVCDACRIARKITEEEYSSLLEVLPKKAFGRGKTFYEGRGCKECNQSGYSGRIGIQEVMPVDSAVRDAILEKATAEKLKKVAVKNGMVTMLEDGLRKARDGITTIEEVLRMLHE